MQADRHGDVEVVLAVRIAKMLRQLRAIATAPLPDGALDLVAMSCGARPTFTRRRDRRVNCSIELAELVGQDLPLVLKAAVAGVGGCQPGGDVKAGLVGGTGPRQGSQRPRRGRRVVRSC